MRAKIVQTYCESTDSSHWFNDKSLYKEKEVTDKNGNKTTAFDLLMADIESEIKRSNDDFIKHYNKKYDTPVMPPAWMTLEVLSLGALSRMYQLLKKSPEKKAIAKAFGLNNDQVLANWLHAIAVWRNCCVHHSRIWNRRCIINVQMSTQCTIFADKHCKFTRKGFAVHSGWHVFLEYAGIIGVFIFVKVLGAGETFWGWGVSNGERMLLLE